MVSGSHFGEATSHRGVFVPPAGNMGAWPAGHEPPRRNPADNYSCDNGNNVSYEVYCSFLSWSDYDYVASSPMIKRLLVGVPCQWEGAEDD